MGRPVLLCRRAGERGKPCYIYGHGEDIGRIHFGGIAALFAQFPCRGRGGGREQAVALPEYGVIILDYFGAHAQRFFIIGIAVAGAENEGSQHNAPLHLSPKPSERLFIKLVYIGAAGGAIAVLDAVKTGKVAGGLGTGKDVVGAESVLSVGMDTGTMTAPRRSRRAMLPFTAAVVSASLRRSIASVNMPILSPRISLPIKEEKECGASRLVESPGSLPLITPSTSALSSTVRVMGPI